MEEVSKEELQTTIIMSFKKDKKAKAKWVDGQFFIVFMSYWRMICLIEVKSSGKISNSPNKTFHGHNLEKGQARVIWWI